jgi:hypothetical protein
LKSSEKIQIFEKVGKNSDKTAEEKLVFFKHFLNFWVPRKRGKVRNSQKYEKSENHCTLLSTAGGAMLWYYRSENC